MYSLERCDNTLNPESRFVVRREGERERERERERSKESARERERESQSEIDAYSFETSDHRGKAMLEHPVSFG